MSLAEIKSAVEALSADELAQLAAFVRERENRAWINKSTPTLLKAVGYLRLPRKRARTFALGACKICRDRQNQSSILEAFRRATRKRAELAREKYALWKTDPHDPSLSFEERRNGICVVRIGEHYRAIGVREGDVVAWFWIGTHEAYNNFRF